jgi:hypothetical protein
MDVDVEPKEEPKEEEREESFGLFVVSTFRISDNQTQC